MPSPMVTLKHIPVARLIAAAEVALLVRQHLLKLDPDERHRIFMLVRQGHGRPRNLSERERRELARLLQKMEPREFVNTATKRLTGVSLPGQGGSRDRSSKHH